MSLFGEEEEKLKIFPYPFFLYVKLWKRDVVIGLLNALPTLSDGEIIQFPGDITKLGGQLLV